MIRSLFPLALGVSLFLAGAAKGETAGAQEEKTLSLSTSLIEHYQQTLEIDPANLLLRYQLGVALLIGGAASAAIDEFRLAYPAMSDSAEMNYHLGLAYTYVNDPDSALLYFEQAEAMGALKSPEIYPLANAYFNLAIAYLDDGNYPEAARLFSRVLGMEPERTDIHRILGDIYAKSGDVAAALEAFSRYLTIYPDDKITREYVFALHYNRGLGLIEENPAAAAAAFSLAVALVPGDPHALYYLGYLDYANGQMGNAAERLLLAYKDAAPELRPAVAALLYNCALALQEQRKLRQALAAITPLAQDPAATAKELVQAGNIHFMLQESAQALDYYQRALAIEPHNLPALQNRLAAETGAVSELLARGESLLQAEEFAAAVKIFEQACVIHPTDPRLRTALLQAQEARGKKAAEFFAAARFDLESTKPLSALTQVRQGLTLEASNIKGRALEEEILAALTAEIAQNLAKADRLLAQGELAAAREGYLRVLELNSTHLQAQEGLRQVSGRFQQAAAEAVLRGNQALTEEKLAVAREAYAEALRWLPDDPAATEGLHRLESLLDLRIAAEVQAGRRALGAGRLDVSREHYQNALRYRDDPLIREDLARIEEVSAERLKALLKTARSARADGDFKRARTLYGQILTVQSAQSAARQELADLEKEVVAAVAHELATAVRDLDAKKYSAAIAGFRRTLELEPTNPEAQKGLTDSRNRLQGDLLRLVADGQTALEKGDLTRAEGRLKAALALDPFQAEAKTALRRLEEVRRSGNRPGDEEQLYLQGIDFYTRGKYEDALVVWEQVLLLAPGHEKARMNIEKTRRKVRQIKEFRGG